MVTFIKLHVDDHFVTAINRNGETYNTNNGKLYIENDLPLEEGLQPCNNLRGMI